MVTATGLLAAFMIRTQSFQIDNLRGLVGSALVAEVNVPSFPYVGGSEGVEWWVSDRGTYRALGGENETPGPKLEALALSSKSEAQPLVEVGWPWQPIHFASPIRGGSKIAVGRIAPSVSGGVLLSLLVVDCVVFIALGATLLRRRVVVPMRQLAEAARAVGEGARGTRVEVDGEGEAAEVAAAFNDMTLALETRSEELEKAVGELRDSNRSLRQARDGLDRAERLASVGSLAAGVAHEVGNPMGAMLAFLDLARRDENLDAATVSHLERAGEQGARVREILRQLLDFSRPPRAVPMPLDLSSVAAKTLGLLRAQSDYENIEFNVEAERDLPQAIADESVVGQILLNLMLNACHAALESKQSPRVTVTVRPAPLGIRSGDSKDAASGRTAMDGMECEVADNGPGVSDEIVERIFDPFFTTKDPGAGTGLGLANALRLAEELGGVLEFSNAGVLEGAAFVLRLPTQEVAATRAVRGEARR